MAASFFSGAHNFSVGEMNVKNVSGDYIDHSTKNVRNTYRGSNNYYSHYDNSYHDSSSHHWGNNYTTTNNNYGPVNNVGSVKNANFGPNHGTIHQNAYDGPQQNFHTENQYEGSTYNYRTEAAGGNVVNGNFRGTQHNNQGAPNPSGQPYAAAPGPSPLTGNDPRFPARRDDRPHAADQDYTYPRPPPAPTGLTASDPAVPKQQYREQRQHQEEAGGIPPPPSGPLQPPDQHQPPLNAPHPIDRTNTAPGRPQPYAESKAQRSNPVSGPPSAFPPVESRGRAPSPVRREQTPPTEDGRHVKRGAGQLTPKKRSWEGEEGLRSELNKHGISYSDSSDSSDGGNPTAVMDLDGDQSDGYGAGSGRQKKEEEAKREREERKEKEAKKERDARARAPAGGWNDNPLLQEANTSQSLLGVPLPPYFDTMPLTPTPVSDGLRKRAASPSPSQKGSLHNSQPRPSPSQLPAGTGNARDVGPSPPAKPHTDDFLSVNGYQSLHSPTPGGQSPPLTTGGSDEDVHNNLHDVLSEGKGNKKKSRNPMKKLVKVFSPSKEKERK